MSLERFNKFVQALGFGAEWDFTNKAVAVNNHIAYQLARFSRMFKYGNLPDTVHRRELEIKTQTRGFVGWIEHQNNIYALNGNLGGELDADLRPTKFVVANPALSNLKPEYTIGVDCVIMPNDDLFIGVLPILEKYGSALADNLLSMYLVDINSRLNAIIEADNDDTYTSAVKLLDDIKAGKQGVIAGKAFLDGLRVNPLHTSNSSNELLALIQYNQYLRAQELREFGIQESFDMKRESINSNEAQLNEDALKTFITSMKLCRQEAIEEVNKMFGTNISVDFDGVWERNEREELAELEALENEAEKEPEAEADAEPENKEGEENDEN